MKILIIEDEKPMALTMKDELSKDYFVDVAYNGEEGEYLSKINNYNLIIIDLMLPGISGIEICQNLRKNSINTPILIVTGRNKLELKVSTLNCGADDYLVKPFSFSELKARIKALIRRHTDYLNVEVLAVGDLAMNPTTKVVTKGENKIPLRRKEFDLLEYLMRNTGRVLSRSTILDHVWDNSYDSSNNTVDVHIKYLRDKIDKPYNSNLIKTIHGFGYKIEA